MTARIAISVIVPVFQDPDGIAACLSALERQSMAAEEFEVIVADNGSVPALAVAGGRLRHFRVIYCPKPGSYAARNAGVRLAHGRYLAFTDADCIPDPHWLKNGIRALETSEREVVLGGEVRYIEPPEPTAVSLYQTSVGFPQQDNIERKGFAATANMFCSRTAFDRTGPFDESLLSGGDMEWAWRAGRAGLVTMFVRDAVVATPPRTSLIGALRQARRVAAGRLQLRRSGQAAGRLDSLQPNRSLFWSFFRVVAQRDLGWFDQLRILAVAGVIRGISSLESIRIRLGGRPERR